MSMAALPACRYMPLMPGAHRGQKGALDLLGLEPQMALSCHVGAGN